VCGAVTVIRKKERAGLPESPLPEPQSTTFFVFLIVVFGGLMWWLAVAKQTVFRILAACLAFIPAMMFGVAAVNKYYDYYQNWNSAIADLTGQNAATAVVPAGEVGTGVKIGTFLGSKVNTSLAASEGLTVRLSVPGRASHITRTVYVYLPPQYFQRSFRNYRFPAIELVHGFPGTPLDWITVVGITTTLQDLISTGAAKPVVLVMPDANGGRAISLQCLNQVGGPEGATYLAQDLPAYIARLLRVQPPGLAWGIAGYSEGGFCAANLGLKYGRDFGYAGVLSGYFAPLDNQTGHPPKSVDPFRGNIKLREANTPDDLVDSLPGRTRIAQFWLGAGQADLADLKAAALFQQLLQFRQPKAILKTVPGGGHTMLTWRALVPPLLEWMTPQLAREVTVEQAKLEKAAQKAAAAKRKKAAASSSPKA
jgi:enterochelin esterase-like enzyme